MIKIMKKVAILTSRPAGLKCFEWARGQIPKDWEIVIIHEHADLGQYAVVISFLYEKIIKELSDKTRYYNFHPAILPNYAGVNCPSWALINQESEYGVTLHKLVPEVDAGEIIEIRKFPLAPDDTAETLYNKAEKYLFLMFKKWFPLLLSSGPKGIEQNRSERRVYKRKDLDAQKDLTRFVRALTFRDKENAFFTTKDGRKYALDYERGIIKIDTALNSVNK